jgi:hypothetical protein
MGWWRASRQAAREPDAPRADAIEEDRKRDAAKAARDAARNVAMSDPLE